MTPPSAFVTQRPNNPTLVQGRHALGVGTVTSSGRDLGARRSYVRRRLAGAGLLVRGGVVDLSQQTDKCEPGWWIGLPRAGRSGSYRWPGCDDVPPDLADFGGERGTARSRVSPSER